MILISLLLLILVVIVFGVRYCIRYIKNYLYFQPYKNHILPKPDNRIKEVWPTYSGSGGKKLHAWLYNPQSLNEKDTPLLLFCHGNAGNISNRCCFMKDMIKCDIPFMFFDYKGFGKSEGSTFLESIADDAELCYDYLKDKLKVKNIIPIGESIGSYAASRLAKTKGLDKLIIFAGMNSISTVVGKLIPIPMAKWITKGDLDVGNNLRDYEGYTLFLHSKKDEIVGYDNVVLNHEICGKDRSRIHHIKGKHNSLELDWNVVKKFIDIVDQ